MVSIATAIASRNQKEQDNNGIGKPPKGVNKKAHSDARVTRQTTIQAIQTKFKLSLFNIWIEAYLIQSAVIYM